MSKLLAWNKKKITSKVHLFSSHAAGYSQEEKKIKDVVGEFSTTCFERFLTSNKYASQRVVACREKEREIERGGQER